MNQTDVMLRIVEMAHVGGALSPEEAIATVAALIDGLNMRSEAYEADAAALLKVGATIWQMASESGAPSGLSP